MPILFSSSRRLAQKLQAFFVRKKKANFANFAYPISACDFLPCNWDLSCFNFDLLNQKKKQELRASCTIACSLFIAFRCFTLETGTIAFSYFVCHSIVSIIQPGMGQPEDPIKKKKAREWTQGPHQREHGTNLIN